MSSTKRTDIIFAIIILTYTIYAGLFIYRTSFVIRQKRYFCLFDDAMISMRYAKNLAEGNGLVYNSHGNPVEGFTNPLWVLYMSIFHLLPVDISKVSLFIQISGAIFLIINLFLVKKIAEYLSDKAQLATLSAVFLTAFYLPLNTWALQGMEVSILTLLITLSTWLILQCLKYKRFSWWLYILLGLGILIRIDMVIPYIAIGAFLVIKMPKLRRQNLLYGAVLFILFFGSQIIFSYHFFGNFLPNTYFLKMTGYPMILRIMRGLYVTTLFFLKLSPIAFLLPLTILFFRKDNVILLFFWVLIAQTIYSIYVGGDAWEWWGGSNRFVVIAMPLFFIIFSYALSNIFSIIASKIDLKKKYNRTLLVNGIFISLLAFLLNFNAIYGPQALSEWVLIKRSLHINDNKTMVERAIIIKDLTNSSSSIAVTWAGIIPYFSDRYTIDLFGKTDQKIAHEPMHIKNDMAHFTDFLPGHNKYDFDYSIGQKKPDVVIPLWKSLKEAKVYLLQYYQLIKVGNYNFFFRRSSHHILWNKIK